MNETCAHFFVVSIINTADLLTNAIPVATASFSSSSMQRFFARFVTDYGSSSVCRCWWADMAVDMTTVLVVWACWVSLDCSFHFPHPWTAGQGTVTFCASLYYIHTWPEREKEMRPSSSISGCFCYLFLLLLLFLLIGSYCHGDQCECVWVIK